MSDSKDQAPYIVASRRVLVHLAIYHRPTPEGESHGLWVHDETLERLTREADTDYLSAFHDGLHSDPDATRNELEAAT